MRPLAVCLLMVLAGCAGTSGSTPLQSTNALNVRKAESGDYDYVVSIPNLKDRNYDPHDKATRDKMALLALKDQCEAPQIVGESVINSGTYLLGNTSKTYEMQVRC